MHRNRTDRASQTQTQSQSQIKLSTDDNLNKVFTNIGYKFTISDTILGSGAYGTVFLATDENGRQLAVKCCPIDNTGIPNILETSIMGSIIHPNLNRALRIQASDTKLYIIQELALTDLSQHTRRDKRNHKPTLDELRKWCYSIAQGVSSLHSTNIIHADIKASNVLLYSDGSVRLTDYTLATKKWVPNENFIHNVCTCTHRPLECLLRQEWNESLDIWSLGCTFYEIAYGELLFPYQGNINTSQKNQDKNKEKEAKIRLKQRSINAIIDWGMKGPRSQKIETVGYNVDYASWVLCDDSQQAEMAIFNDLIYSMLMIDPKKRPSIQQVIKHEFFQGIKTPLYLSITRPLNKLSVSEQARVTRYIQRYTDNENIQNLALNIYCKCNDLEEINEHIRAATACWIACKLIAGRPPDIPIPPNRILSAEREICHNIGFRLHI